ARDVRPEDAILDREVAKFERGEDDVFGHDTTSVAGAAIARCHTARSSAGTKAVAGHCAQCPTMNSTSPPGRALTRSFEFENDEGARAHRAADGGARDGGLAQHARWRKQALFDDGIDGGWGAPPRLAPQLTHAFEAAHEVVHGDAGGMNPGEIAMNEI